MKDARIVAPPVNTDRETKSVNITSMVQMFNSASNALLAQANLHRQLAQVEWQEEKNRLSRMLAAVLIGFSCFICLLIFVGVLLVSLSWNTDYRLLALVSLCTFYALVTFLAWRQFTLASKMSGGFFAGTRAELAADLAMIRSKFQ
jgi:uncharacterized membrane protein YqjE